MVARLQDDCEKLGKMVTVARQTSRALGAPAGPSSVSGQTLAPTLIAQHYWELRSRNPLHASLALPSRRRQTKHGRWTTVGFPAAEE